MNTTTISGGAVATTTCAHTRVWRERPVTRRLASVLVPVQGTTLPIAGQCGATGPIAFPVGADLGMAPAATANKYMTSTSMDVPPFRTGRPPV